MGYNIDGMAMDSFVKVHPGNPKAGIGFTSTKTKLWRPVSVLASLQRTRPQTHVWLMETQQVAHYYKYDYFW